MFIKKTDLHNFADDDTIPAFYNDLDFLILTLTEELKNGIAWFYNNDMIVRTSKFEDLTVNLSENFGNAYNFLIDNRQISSTSFVTLLGMQLGNKLNLKSHVSIFSKQEAAKLNALYQLEHYINFSERKILVEGFIF